MKKSSLQSSLLLTLVVIAVAVVSVAGCGGDNNDNAGTTETTPSTTPPPSGGGGAGKATELKISADSSALKFNETSLTTKAGKVTIVMDNPSDTPHSVSLEGNGVDEEGTGGTTGVGKGETSTVTADLKPGTYTFFCPVDAHEQAGMKGTLTVE